MRTCVFSDRDRHIKDHHASWSFKKCEKFGCIPEVLVAIVLDLECPTSFLDG